MMPTVCMLCLRIRTITNTKQIVARPKKLFKSKPKLTKTHPVMDIKIMQSAKKQRAKMPSLLPNPAVICS